MGPPRRLGALAVSLLAALMFACSESAGPTARNAPPAQKTAQLSPGQYPVQTFFDQGRQHLAPDQTFNQYNSNPPTSGPHSPIAARWGIYDQPVPKEVLVHNMEHGGVIVWYNCRGGPQPLTEAQCQELRNNLARVVQTYLSRGRLIVMTPYPDMPRRIALTAWTRLDAFDDFDEARLASFIERYERAFNPEGF